MAAPTFVLPFSQVAQQARDTYIGRFPGDWVVIETYDGHRWLHCRQCDTKVKVDLPLTTVTVRDLIRCACTKAAEDAVEWRAWFGPYCDLPLEAQL
jgi:hypothetical protein